MTLIELAKPGDKIDIQLIQQLELEEQGKRIEPVRIYKSRVYDFLSERELEIAMPTEGGKLVLFQLGLRCKMLFYTKKGMYSCVGIVRKRYKKDNFYMLSLLLQTDPVKFQRREYFRIGCSFEMQYFHISEEVAAFDSTERLFEEIQKQEYFINFGIGTVLDISGGGMRFSTHEKLENEQYLLTVIRLTNSQIDQTFYLVVQIIESALRKGGENETYINRAKFLFKDLKDREIIIRYVFEEERRLRMKVNG